MFFIEVVPQFSSEKDLRQVAQELSERGELLITTGASHLEPGKVALRITDIRLLEDEPAGDATFYALSRFRMDAILAFLKDLAHISATSFTFLAYVEGERTKETNEVNINRLVDLIKGRRIPRGTGYKVKPFTKESFASL